MSDIKFTKGSGNVFTDLGLDNAEELETKSTLAMMIRDLIKKRGLTQVEAAKLLGTHQTQIARLKKSKFVSGMSLDLLMHWLTKFNRDITVIVTKAPRSHHEGSIRIAM
jgi:predicted XRE-type DNA-binding protein